VSFKDEYLSEPYKPSALEEAYLQAWLTYHRAADLYDGHITYPRNAREYKQVRRAALAGASAMARYLKENHLECPHHTDKVRYPIWQHAKRESLRRLGQ